MGKPNRMTLTQLEVTTTQHSFLSHRLKRTTEELVSNTSIAHPSREVGIEQLLGRLVLPSKHLCIAVRHTYSKPSDLGHCLKADKQMILADLTTMLVST